MVLDEKELRDYLNATADQASAAGFTVESLAGRIRRRRARIAGLFGGLLLAVAGVAVAIPVSLTASRSPLAGYSGIPLPPQLSFTIAVNGQVRVFPEHGPPPSFTVRPAEKLVLEVDITVPAHTTVTALWLGITSGLLAPRPGGPADMRPILAARPHLRLRPGPHRFRLTWVVPARPPAGADQQLSLEWIVSAPAPDVAERIIAELTR